MKKDGKKDLLIKERQEAVKEMRKRLEAFDTGSDIRLVLDASIFSQQDLADIIDCDRSNISDICNRRKNNINLEQLILISVALGEHNFLDKIFDLLNPQKESILPERYTIDVNPSSVRIIHHAEQVSAKIFRLQKE